MKYIFPLLMATLLLNACSAGEAFIDNISVPAATWKKEEYATNRGGKRCAVRYGEFEIVQGNEEPQDPIHTIIRNYSGAERPLKTVIQVNGNLYETTKQKFKTEDEPAMLDDMLKSDVAILSHERRVANRGGYRLQDRAAVDLEPFHTQFQACVAYLTSSGK